MALVAAVAVIIEHLELFPLGVVLLVLLLRLTIWRHR